jgi:outer membrane protein assembly factor BamB
MLNTQSSSDLSSPVVGTVVGLVDDDVTHLEVVYFGSDDGRVRAVRQYDPATEVDADAELWESVVLGDTIEGAPLLSNDGTLYVGSSTGISRLLQEDGTAASTTLSVDEGLSASPILTDDGSLFFASETQLHRVSVDLIPFWSCMLTEETDHSSPLLSAGGVAVIGDDLGNLIAIQTLNATAASSRLDNDEITSCMTIALWVYKVGGNIRSTPLLDELGQVIFGARDGLVHSVDIHTGQGIWTFDAGGTENFDSSPALAPFGTHVYVVSTSCMLIVFKSLHSRGEGSAPNSPVQALVEQGLDFALEELPAELPCLLQRVRWCG